MRLTTRLLAIPAIGLTIGLMGTATAVTASAATVNHSVQSNPPAGYQQPEYPQLMQPQCPCSDGSTQIQVNLVPSPSYTQPALQQSSPCQCETPAPAPSPSLRAAPAPSVTATPTITVPPTGSVPVVTTPPVAVSVPPVGAPSTGGGSTAGLQNQVLIGTGGIAILAGLVVIAFAYRKRSQPSDL